MVSTESDSAFPNTYWYGKTDLVEIERLDALHQGIKTYLDGEFFLAPLVHPQTILDIGAGSGKWAIDIAEKFPDGQVTAVDISPMFPRPVPPNFQFQQLDITADPLPWGPGSFDVVHVRLVLIHLPNPERALERITRLVKPGGWLLAEDITVTGDVTGDAPAVRTAIGLLYKSWESNGQDPRAGEKIESWLRQTGSFSEVNVHEVIMPVGNRSSATAAAAQNPDQQEQEREERQAVLDPKLRALELAFTNSTRGTFATEKYHPRMLELGFTPEAKSQCLEQFSTSEWRMDMPLHFVWARKSV